MHISHADKFFFFIYDNLTQSLTFHVHHFLFSYLCLPRRHSKPIMSILSLLKCCYLSFVILFNKLATIFSFIFCRALFHFFFIFYNFLLIFFKFCLYWLFWNTKLTISNFEEALNSIFNFSISFYQHQIQFYYPPS